MSLLKIDRLQILTQIHEDKYQLFNVYSLHVAIFNVLIVYAKHKSNSSKIYSSSQFTNDMFFSSNRIIKIKIII